MASSLSFFQQGQKKASIKPKSLEAKKDAVEDNYLFADPNPKLTILTPTWIGPDDMRNLIKYIRGIIGKTPFQVIYCTKFHHLDEDVKSVVEFYRQYSINYKVFNLPNGPILTMGRAIYSVGLNPDLQPPHFYDTVWNKNFFYAPHIERVVYPVEAFFTMWDDNKHLRKDNFEWVFFEKQLRNCMNHEENEKFFPKISPNIIDVLDTEKFFDEFDEPKEVACDLETTGLHFYKNEIVCMVMSFDGITGYYLPWNKIDKNKLNHFLRNKYQIWAHGKFDCKFLRHRGVTNARVDFDTLHAGHCLNEMRSNSLKTHAFLFTRHGGYEDALSLYKKKYSSAKENYGNIPKTILMPYAVMDAIVTFQTYNKMLEQLIEDSLLYRYYFEDVIPSIEMYLRMELRGVKIDWEACREVGREIKGMIEETKIKIFQTLKEYYANRKTIRWEDLDIDSPTRLGKFLEFELGWPLIERTKTPIDRSDKKSLGIYATGKTVMKEWKKLGIPAVDLFMDYFGLKSAYTAFSGSEEENNGLWQYRCDNGRIYPTFWVMLAKSGRNRCSEPNLQNIPKRSKLAELLRKSFTCDEDEFIGDSDGAGLQVRIATSLSGDLVLREAFTTGDGDVHSQVAAKVFCGTFSVYPIRVEDETGKVWDLISTQPMKVFRNSVEQYILAQELDENDFILEIY